MPPVYSEAVLIQLNFEVTMFDSTFNAPMEGCSYSQSGDKYFGRGPQNIVCN